MRHILLVELCGTSHQLVGEKFQELIIDLLVGEKFKAPSVNR